MYGDNEDNEVGKIIVSSGLNASPDSTKALEIVCNVGKICHFLAISIDCYTNVAQLWWKKMCKM
jgi:hypothetical protein